MYNDAKYAFSMNFVVLDDNIDRFISWTLSIFYL